MESGSVFRIIATKGMKRYRSPHFRIINLSRRLARFVIEITAKKSDLKEMYHIDETINKTLNFL